MAENDTENTGSDLDSEPSESGVELVLPKFEEKKIEFFETCGFNPNQVNLTLTPLKKDFYSGSLTIDQISSNGREHVEHLPSNTATELDDLATSILQKMILTSGSTVESFEIVEKHHGEIGSLEDKAVWAHSHDVGEKTFFIRVAKKKSGGGFELFDEATGASMTDAIKTFVGKWQT